MTKPNILPEPVLGLDGIPVCVGDQVVTTSVQGNLHTGVYLGYDKLDYQPPVQSLSLKPNHHNNMFWMRLRIYYTDSTGKRRYLNEFGWTEVGQIFQTLRMIKR